MRDSDRRATSLEAAWDNLQLALEMYEGEIWRSEHQLAGQAVCRMMYARRLLEQAARTLVP